MKLYKKGFRNMAELRQEKRKLLREKKQLDSEPLLTLDDVVAGVCEGGGVMGILSGVLPSVLPMLSSFSGPVFGTIAEILKNRFGSGKSAGGEEKKTESGIGGVVKNVGKEALGSYIAWKVLELSFKGVKSLIKDKKKKKKDRQQAGAGGPVYDGSYTH